MITTRRSDPTRIVSSDYTSHIHPSYKDKIFRFWKIVTNELKLLYEIMTEPKSNLTSLNLHSDRRYLIWN